MGIQAKSSPHLSRINLNKIDTKRKLSAAEREHIILENREKAFRMARRVCHSAITTLSQDEIRSISDHALCEAALRYSPMPGATFLTYVFYFIKGEVRKALFINGHLGSEVESIHGEEREGLLEDDRMEADYGLIAEEVKFSPEILTYQAQMRKSCKVALQKLSVIEQKVVLGALIGEQKMAHLAKELGYSRGHLFAIKKLAEEKMRLYLADFDYDLAA